MRFEKQLFDNQETYMNNNFKNEEWKDITDYEGIYQIASSGRVKNLKTGRILKTVVTKCGYEMVILCKNCKTKGLTVHRLLGIHFIPNGNPDVFTVINHKDGNKLNNQLTNLEWCTPASNIQHAYANGLVGMGYKKVHKLNIITGEILTTYESLKAAAKDVGISESSICSALKGRYKQAKGFKWQYAQ